MDYKNILVVVFDKNKSNKALKEVQKILSENNTDHEIYNEDNDANSYSGYDLVLVIGGDGSMLSAAKLFSHINCPFLGINLGSLLGAGVVTSLHYGVSTAAMLSWGWRLPFVASAVLFLLGRYMRRQAPESADFLRQQNFPNFLYIKISRRHNATLFQ